MRRILIACTLVLLARTVAAAQVNVSTIAVAGQTVTVTTATNHGLAVNQGVCLTNTAACTAVATTPTSTTFTVTQPSNNPIAVCASSCGTASTAPKIIILDVSQPTQADMTVHYLLWLTTTQPVPLSGAISVWKSGAGSVGATTAQNNAISAGNFIEKNLTETFASNSTSAQVQTFLQNRYTTQQAALAANTQPGQFYGSVWDGAGWSVQ